jgi:hypothetical protein
VNGNMGVTCGVHYILSLFCNILYSVKTNINIYEHTNEYVYHTA